jgi:hypothetical protein
MLFGRLVMIAAFRWALGFLSVISCLLLSPRASAVVTEEGAPNLMVRPFNGPKAITLQERVVRVLEEQGADLVPAGFEGPKPLEQDADFAEAAARLNIRAYLLGEVTNDNSGWTLRVKVRQGSDGTEVGKLEFTASWFPGLLTKIEEELVPSLEKILSGAKVPEAAPEEAEPEAEEVVLDEKPRPQPLNLDAGLGFVFRNYAGSQKQNFNDPFDTRDQSGGLATLRVGAGFYPMALFSKSFLANVGLIGHFEQSLGGTTQAAGGEALDTSLRAYELGLRVRFPVRTHELGVSALYGKHTYEIATPSDNNVPAECGLADPTQEGPCYKPVPDVDYGYIRLGTDFTLNLNKYSFSGNLGLRIVDSAGSGAGQIQNDEWYTRSDVGGVDLSLVGGYALNDRLSLLVGVDFRNFYYSMNSRVEDFGEGPDGILARRPVAGGATDMYLGGMISAQYSLR